MSNVGVWVSVDNIDKLPEIGEYVLVYPGPRMGVRTYFDDEDKMDEKPHWEGDGEGHVISRVTHFARVNPPRSEQNRIVRFATTGKVCPCCGIRPAEDEHTCPYQMNDLDFECECCFDCQQSCGEDI